MCTFTINGLCLRGHGVLLLAATVSGIDCMFLHCSLYGTQASRAHGNLLMRDLELEMGDSFQGSMFCAGSFGDDL